MGILTLSTAAAGLVWWVLSVSLTETVSDVLTVSGGKTAVLLCDRHTVTPLNFVTPQAVTSVVFSTPPHTSIIIVIIIVIVVIIIIII